MTDNHAFKQVSPEVFYSDGGFLAADRDIIDFLKGEARKSPRHRCRLCFHADADDRQQEMLIVMHRDSYVRPHRHLGKVETFSVIEGNCDVLLFDEQGALTTRMNMTAPNDNGCFFYRMPEGIYHSLLFTSEWLVFVETTIGPFDRSMSEDAPWAPPETDQQGGQAFLSSA